MAVTVLPFAKKTDKVIRTYGTFGITRKVDFMLISGFHRALLQSITFIIRLMHSII